MNRPSIEVSPVDNGADEDTAEVIGGLVRAIERGSHADVAYTTTIDHAVTGGFGFFRLGIEYAHAESFELAAKIKRVANPLMVRWDASSTEFDASDWEYAFVSDWLTAEEFKKKYPKADPVSFEGSDTQDALANWCDGDKVMVAEYWRRTSQKEDLLQLSDGRVVREDHLAKQAQDAAQALGAGKMSDEEAIQAYMAAFGLEEQRRHYFFWAHRSLPTPPGQPSIFQGGCHAMSGKATVGEVITAFLEECGVGAAFGVISIHNMPFLDAIGQRGKIRYVSARSEPGAINMADAYARVGARLGVAFTSTGTAAGNASGAMVEAQTAGTSLLHITGQIDLEHVDKEHGFVHEARDTFFFRRQRHRLDRIIGDCHLDQRCVAGIRHIGDLFDADFFEQLMLILRPVPAFGFFAYHQFLLCSAKNFRASLNQATRAFAASIASSRAVKTSFSKCPVRNQPVLVSGSRRNSSKPNVPSSRWKISTHRSPSKVSIEDKTTGAIGR